MSINIVLDVKSMPTYFLYLFIYIFSYRRKRAALASLSMLKWRISQAYESKNKKEIFLEKNYA